MIRDAGPDDRAYIEQTFARSYAGAAAIRGAEPATWLAEAQRVVRGWLDEGARVVVHVADEDHDAIIGWVCGTSSVLHYVYVRSDFRGGGIARGLYQHIGSPRAYTMRPASPRVRVPDGWRFTPRLTMGACA